VETLEASGRWFKEHFSVTPPTAFSVLSDVRNEGNKTVWFNSRYYRANLLWKDKFFRFRDIHLFDENFESDYLTKAYSRLCRFGLCSCKMPLYGICHTYKPANEHR
ncbi:hypothetical protein EZS27_036685, partial [termite gut metagenome]